MNKLILTATAIFASVAAFASTAQAQTYSSGDLALLFRINNGTGTGNTQDVEVNLGTTFNFALPQVVENLSSILTPVYGSSALSNPNLVYTLVDVSSASTEDISDPNNATPFTQTLAASLQGDEQILSEVYSESGGAQIGSTNAYNVTVNSSDSNTYTTVIRDTAGAKPGGPYNVDYNLGAFGSFANDTTEESVDPTGTSAIELYSDTEVPGGKGHPTVYTVADLGSFYISGNNLDFSPAAVPEPSTYAMLALGGLALVVIRRRMIA